MRVLKYGPFQPDMTFTVPGKVIHFGSQHGGMYVWSEVQDDDIDEFPYHIYGTGWNIPYYFTHLFTAMSNGGFVWHLYRV